jgi:hypothetical protein
MITVLENTTINSISLNTNDIFNNGKVNIRIKEIFQIEDQIYLALITEGIPMMKIKFSKDTEEYVTPNRYIMLADLWVAKNQILFQ